MSGSGRFAARFIDIIATLPADCPARHFSGAEVDQKYRIVAVGLKDGFTRAQSAELLATLFKRPAHELSALTSGKRVTVKKALDLPAAIKYKAALERCGLLAEVAPDNLAARASTSSQPAGTPLPARELARLETCARHILATLKDEHGGDPAYDARSIGWLAADLNAGRHGYTAEQTRKIAKFYGAFLGKVLIEMFPGALPRWVGSEHGAAIEFRRSASGGPLLVVPAACIEQHIAHGEEQSIVTFLQQQRRLIDGVSAAPEATPEHSVLQLAGSAGHAPLDIAMPLAFCCNCGTTEDVAVLDVELSTRAKGDSALWLELPFCGACTATADRVRAGVVKTGLLTVGTFLLTGLPVILATRELRVLGFSTTVLVVPVFALATGAVLYLLDRARAPQTSRYQPVMLESFDHTPAGERHVGFGFSNPEYAAAFASANAQEISAGRIGSVY